MNFAVIIQARTGSTRLPGKVLKELPYGSGITVLEQVIRRVNMSKFIDKIIVATTCLAEDDVIEKISNRMGVTVFRGDEQDVLARYYYAAMECGYQNIIRVTSDCPCIDWEVIDRGCEVFSNGGFDYVSNTIERTYPHGLDYEVFAFTALKEAFENADNKPYREHVTPYIKTGDFNKLNLEAPKDINRPQIRITLDTEEDYALLAALYEDLYCKNNDFRCKDIVDLFEKKPWLKIINSKILQKEIYKDSKEELTAAVKLLEKQEMHRARNVIINKLDE